MDNTIWGPYFWFTLHTITIAYPDNPTYNERRYYNDFFLSLQNVLPCPLCREHYKQHLQEYPISVHLGNKEEIVKWCFNLHNRVNRSLGKPDFKYEDFKEKYRKIYTPTLFEKVVNTENLKKYKKYKIILLIILTIIVTGLIYYFYNKRNNRNYFFR